MNQSIARNLGEAAALEVASWGDGADVDLVERFCLLVEDGRMREPAAWKYALELERKRHCTGAGVSPET